MTLLGFKLKDKVIGFSGFATGYCTYLTGCAQYLITPPVKDGGDIIEPRWYDEGRLSKLEEAPSFSYEDVNTNTMINGSDKPTPIR